MKKTENRTDLQISKPLHIIYIFICRYVDVFEIVYMIGKFINMKFIKFLLVNIV